MVNRAAPLVIDATVTALQRAVHAALPTARPHGRPIALEGTASPEVQRLVAPQVLEGDRLQRLTIAGEPVVAFAAFQDGTQRSTELAYVRSSVPIVHGSVAAVARERVDRRLRTWRHVVRQALYAPRALLSPREWSAIAGVGIP